MRWKTVLSRYFACTSLTKDAAAFGDCFGSRRIVKLPQFVLITTSYVFDASSGCVGFVPVRAFVEGADTDVHPFSFVLVPPLPPPPPPQAASRQTKPSSARRRTAANLRDGSARPLDERLRDLQLVRGAGQR